MSPEERAQHYAGLFTALGAKWRTCIPCDGTPHKFLDQMHLQGVRIEKPEGFPYWKVVRA